jgi:hypothetical protein
MAGQTKKSVGAGVAPPIGRKQGQSKAKDSTDLKQSMIQEMLQEQIKISREATLESIINEMQAPLRSSSQRLQQDTAAAFGRNGASSLAKLSLDNAWTTMLLCNPGLAQHMYSLMATQAPEFNSALPLAGNTELPGVLNHLSANFLGTPSTNAIVTGTSTPLEGTGRPSIRRGNSSIGLDKLASVVLQDSEISGKKRKASFDEYNTISQNSSRSSMSMDVMSMKPSPVVKTVSTKKGSSGSVKAEEKTRFKKMLINKVANNFFADDDGVLDGLLALSQSVDKEE